MIVLTHKKIKYNFKEIKKNYNFYVNNLNLGLLSCPFCESNDFIKWGHYERNVIYIDSGEIMYETIKIQRIKCNCCGKTHALIPSFIVPYKMYALDVILASIAGYEYTLDISYDTICFWGNQFRKFSPQLNTLLHGPLNLINYILEDLFSVLNQFYLVNKKIIMMTHAGFFNMDYF